MSLMRSASLLLSALAVVVFGTGSLGMSLLCSGCGSEHSSVGESVQATDISAQVAEQVIEPSAEEPAPPSSEPALAPFDYSDWESLLSEHVTDDGGFRYRALHDSEVSRERLNRFVRLIGDASVAERSRDAQLAFYINAYNALTVHSVIELWPIQSVMEEDGFFETRTHRIAGREQTLNELENDIIRGEQFEEPRIHFAVNCASVGCPPLQGHVFTPDNIETQLSAAAEAFVRARTNIGNESAELSKIFEWFAADFEEGGGVRAFIGARLEADGASRISDERVSLTFVDYDWALNGRP